MPEQPALPPPTEPSPDLRPTVPSTRSAKAGIVYAPSSMPETPIQRALWGVGGGIGCLLLLLLAVAIPTFLATSSVTATVGRFEQLWGVLSEAEPPRAQVNASETIVNYVRPLGQLVSTSAQLAQADLLIQVEQGTLSTCNHAARHVITGTIEAGVDLLTVQAENVRYDANTDTYFLTLPHPQITSCRVDFIDQYEQERGLIGCNPDWDSVRQLAQYSALIGIRDDAIDGGILLTAERNTEQALVGFISALTDANVVIAFEGNPTPLPASCQPEPPRNWVYQTELDRWLKTN